MSKKKQNKAYKAGASSLAATKSVIQDTTTKKSSDSDGLLFHKGNYILILAGLGLIFLGYVLMAGGSMPDANTWDPDIIYSTRRTLIAPILILAGLGLEVYAVFKK